MRPLLLAVTLLAASLATAQEPLAPAVEQADDAEAPPAIPPPTPEAPATRRPALQLLAPPPPGWSYRVVDGPPARVRRWGLFTAGMVTFSVAWAANLQAGISTGQIFVDVPLIGPLLELTNMSGGDPIVGWIDFMLVSDALVQMGGLAMVIASAKRYENKPGGQRIELVPYGAGAAIRGSF